MQQRKILKSTVSTVAQSWHLAIVEVPGHCNCCARKPLNIPATTTDALTPLTRCLPTLQLPRMPTLQALQTNIRSDSAPPKAKRSH